MHREDVDAALSQVAFEFFFWFSRFEFALKENGYLKSRKAGATAEPGWDDFTARWHSEYLPSKEALLLLKAPPDRQIVLEDGNFDWTPVGLRDCKSELARVVSCLGPFGTISSTAESMAAPAGTIQGEHTSSSSPVR